MSSEIDSMFGDMPKGVTEDMTLSELRRLRFEELKAQRNVRLSDVYKTYDKWLCIKDRGRIDVVLAAALTRRLTGTPIWLFLVGPSGDGKSEQLMALNEPENTVIIHEITPSTLVSGMSTDKQNLDLAPKLKDKVVLIPDMAALLNMHPNDKLKLWGQLRELYDGRAGKTTGISDAKYSGIRVTLLACSTPSIDAQTTIFNSLGTRELHFRTYEGDHEKVMQKVLENEKAEEQMREELQEVTQSFLRYTLIKDMEWPENVKNCVIGLIDYLRYMRAGADKDSGTGELRADVHPEQPTRVLKQMRRLYVALKSLDDGYTDEQAVNVLHHIVVSSINPNRRRVLECFEDEGDKISQYIVANRCKIGVKTAYGELGVLWNMGLLNKQIEENVDRPWQHTEYWFLSQKGKEIRGKIIPSLNNSKGNIPLPIFSEEKKGGEICGTRPDKQGQ